MCAHCLRAGTRVEETAQHVHHTCPKARAVWEAVIRDWNEKTGDTLDPSDPKTAVAGLREAPREIAGPVKQEWEAREPAWRLLHAVTCQEIYRARCRVHAAYHASPRGEAKAVKLRDVIQRIRRTIQRRVEYEHSRAAHARQHSHQHGPVGRLSRDTGSRQEWRCSPAAARGPHYWGPRSAGRQCRLGACTYAR